MTLPEPTPPFGAIPLTASARAFFAENHRLAALRGYLVNGTAALQRLVDAAFADGADATSARAQLAADLRYENDETPPYPEEVNFSFHRNLVAEMLVGRCVDNFLCYLTELLTQVFKARPEMLRSSGTERLDFVLQYDDMTELRHALAEKRVNAMAYMGVRELNKELSTKYGILLFVEGDALEEAVFWIEVRNAIVHTRGVVSRIAASRSPRLLDHEGQRVPISWDSLRSVTPFLRRSVLAIDQACSAKFSLPVQTGNLVPAELRL